MKNKEINIFCSISPKRLKETNRLLIPSLEKQTTDYKIILSLVNYTGEETITTGDIRETSIEYKILNPKRPLGFGESHNYAFTEIKPKDFFLIINPDIYMEENCLEEMLNTFQNNIGLVEARQLPFTHPKDLPQTETFETNWASGCCLLINSRFFKKVEGFDPNYWMYLEDVDLSWKTWINNYRVVQNPKAVVYHYTGLYFKYSKNSYTIEDFWSMRNFLYLSYVYFGEKGLKDSVKLTENIYNTDGIKDAAIENFLNLKTSRIIKHIQIPKALQDKLKIYDFNKFSEFPK